MVCSNCTRWVLAGFSDTDEKFHPLSQDRVCFAESSLKPINLLFTGSNILNAWSNFARPSGIKNILPSRPIRRDEKLGPRSRFECLPAEIIDEILSFIPVPNDVLALGLCSEKMWSHALCTIERGVRKNIAPLAGKKVICTLDPPGILPAGFSNPMEFGETNFKVNVEKQTYSLEDIWWKAFKDHLYTPGKSLRNPKMLAFELLSRTSLDMGPLDTKLIFRNLTKKQYIRCKRINFSEGQLGGAVAVDHHYNNGGKLFIDDILFARICFQPPPLWSSRGNDERWIGHWVGHCFDIVPLSKEGKYGIDDTWKDCTEDVMEESIELWAKKKGVVGNVENKIRSFREGTKGSRIDIEKW